MRLYKKEYAIQQSVFYNILFYYIIIYIYIPISATYRVNLPIKFFADKIIWGKKKVSRLTFGDVGKKSYLCIRNDTP